MAGRLKVCGKRERDGAGAKGASAAAAGMVRVASFRCRNTGEIFMEGRKFETGRGNSRTLTVRNYLKGLGYSIRFRGLREAGAKTRMVFALEGGAGGGAATLEAWAFGKERKDVITCHAERPDDPDFKFQCVARRHGSTSSGIWEAACRGEMDFGKMLLLCPCEPCSKSTANMTKTLVAVEGTEEYVAAEGPWKESAE